MLTWIKIILQPAAIARLLTRVAELLQLLKDHPEVGTATENILQEISQFLTGTK